MFDLETAIQTWRHSFHLSAVGATAMVCFQVLGWCAVLVLLYRLSLRTSADSNDFRSWIGIAAIALAIISPMLASATQAMQVRLFSVTEFGDSMMVSMVGG